MKKVVICRGIPASGKSTFVQILKEVCQRYFTTYSIHSTDDKFMVDGVYTFNPKFLSAYHKENYDEYCVSISNNKEVIIVDNTNIQPYETDKYIVEAIKNGYQVVSVLFYPDELQKHYDRQTHGVPLVNLERMRCNLLQNPKIWCDSEFVIQPEDFTIKNLVAISTIIVKD